MSSTFHPLCFIPVHRYITKRASKVSQYNSVVPSWASASNDTDTKRSNHVHDRIEICCRSSLAASIEAELCDCTR